jgi:hypothetical protein
MSEQEPVTPTEQAPLDEGAAPAALQTPPTGAYASAGYEPVEEREDEWPEDHEELPRRPRRRLLGTGGNPIALALLGVLLCACGFIGGVLVEKGQSSSSSSTGAGAAASLASRFRALRGGGGAGAGGGAGIASALAGGSSGAGGGFTRPTAGTVAYLAGSTLYVTNAEGNTVKVTTSPATSVTKTVKSSVPGIHPGETVTITGTTGSNGALSAESISVGSSGGLASLFGGGGSGGAGGGAGGSAASTSAKEPSLFGGGG